jgi:hypothetical protein
MRGCGKQVRLRLSIVACLILLEKRSAFKLWTLTTFNSERAVLCTRIGNVAARRRHETGAEF